MSFAWTAEQIELLSQRHAQGLSYRIIAGELGTSVGAVAGKVKRLNLTARGCDYASRMLKLTKPSKPPCYSKTDRRHVKAPTRLSIQVVPGSVPVDLFNRTGCAYPVTEHGPHLFCNCVLHEKSDYCEFHSGVMFNVR